MAPALVLVVVFLYGVVNGVLQGFGIMPFIGMADFTFEYWAEALTRSDLAASVGFSLYIALVSSVVALAGGIVLSAALCAVRLCPAAEKAVFASHCSTEPAARLVLEALGKTPLLTAGLHLGEGTGAVASIPLWDMALAGYRDCYSFTEGGITPYTPQC